MRFSLHRRFPEAGAIQTKLPAVYTKGTSLGCEDWWISFAFKVLWEMSGIAVGRLTEERKNWRKDHPPGFYARPVKKEDNSTDIMCWETGIPGREGKLYVRAVYGLFNP